MRTMKFLSLITVLIVLVTLFTLVISQLNKDETKHEYGIAFPLEETETRLQMTLPSQQQLTKTADNTNNNEQATTTTETVATFSSTSDTVAQQTQQSNSRNKLIKGIGQQNGGQQQKNDDLIIGGEQQSGSTSSMSMPSTQQNNPDPASDDDDSGDDDDDEDAAAAAATGKDSNANSTKKQDENSNPKLIFIERLMDLNFQRPPPPPPSSPFVEVRDLFEESTKKDDNNKTNKDEPSKDETPWSNTFEQIRSRWENRLRKFTYPLQNTYSVVLRASNVVDGSNDTGDNNNPENLLSDINDKSNRVDQFIQATATAAQDGDDQQQQQQPTLMVTPNVKFFYQQQQAALPIGGGGAMNIIGSQSSPNPQANQLFRMAALSMMSKLFSAIRSQAMIPSKLDPSGHKMTNDLENHELDLDNDDDDDDEIDHDERAMAAGAIPLPILVGQKSRNVPDPDPDADTESIRTTTIMFGRPSPIQYPMMGPRIPASFLQPQPQQPQSLPNPLAAILQATAAAAARQQSYRRFAEQQQQQLVSPPAAPVLESAPHPQRLILLITHRSTPTPMAATANLDRDEPMMFHQSQSQPSYAYYSPLSPPSSPILYQTQSPQPSASAMAQSQSLPVVSSSPMVSPSMPQQVVEVPVPVYVPVRVRGPVRGPSPPQPLQHQHQQQPTAIEQIAAAAAARPIISPRAIGPASTGPIAIVYVHNNNNNNDQAQQPDERMVVNENAYSQQQQQQQQQQQPQMPTPAIAIAAPAAATNMDTADPESSGNQAAIVRILFRPKSSSMLATAGEPSGLSFHRRLEQEFASEEDQSQQNAMMMSSGGVQYPYDSRMQQWRDYQQLHQQSHQPIAAMTHVILTATGIRSNDDDGTSMMEQDGPSSSIGYQQAYSGAAAGPTIESQFYFSDADQQAQPAQQPSMVAAAQPSQPLVAASAATAADPSQPNDEMGNGHHHAFLILADPSDPSLPQNTQIGNPNQD